MPRFREEHQEMKCLRCDKEVEENELGFHIACKCPKRRPSDPQDLSDFIVEFRKRMEASGEERQKNQNQSKKQDQIT
jgi:DNA-directed RNA polymerase subunit RPC12/RpoP